MKHAKDSQRFARGIIDNQECASNCEEPNWFVGQIASKVTQIGSVGDALACGFDVCFNRVRGGNIVLRDINSNVVNVVSRVRRKAVRFHLEIRSRSQTCLRVCKSAQASSDGIIWPDLACSQALSIFRRASFFH